MALRFLIEKEFIQIRRNAFVTRLVLLFPVIIMCVMPWVMNMEVRGIVVDVVDNDRSPVSAALAHRIEASDYFVFNGQKASYAEAMDDVEDGAADAVVELPPHYGRDLALGLMPRVLVATNAVNGTKGTMGNAYLTNVVAQHVSELAGTGKTAGADGATVLYLYNKHLNYKLFMIPSLLAILVMLVCGFLPALNIVGEKESGTIEAINVTPASKAEFILAKLVPYWVIALVVMTACLVLAWAVYGVTSAGSLWLVYLLAMLLAFVFSGLGLVVSNHNETMQQAVFVMWFVVVCLLLLSGLFTPVRSMPHWAYLTTYVNPMNYFIEAIRTVFVRGGGFSEIARQVAALAVIAAGMNVWAIASYRKNR